MTTPVPPPPAPASDDDAGVAAADPGPPRLTRRRLLLGAGGVAVAGVTGWIVLDRRADEDGTSASPAPPGSGGPTTTDPPRTTPSTAPTATIPTFNVRDHGAVGDGRADDSAAVAATIVAALDASKRLNDGVDPTVAATAPTVVFPPGTYASQGLVDLRLDAPLALRGEPGAVVEMSGARRSHSVLRGLSSLDVEGLEVRGGGTWIDLADLPHDVALLRVVGCTFREVAAPIDSWPGGGPLPHGPDRLELEDNVIEGNASRDPELATFGFGLQIQRWGDAVVRGNVVSGVFQHGLRIGHQVGEGRRDYRDRAGLTCTGNTVTGVWGTEKSNGIIVGASRVRISGNVVEDVTSGRDERRGIDDTEGIYVKGDDLTISDNRLLDGGRAQAQITVKGTNARIQGNRIEVTVAHTGGIRAEDLHTEIRGNEIIGILPGQDAISVQDDPRDDTIVVADNVIRGGHPKHAIYVGRRAHVVVTGNHVLDAPTEQGAIRVQTLGQGTVGVMEVRGNLVRGADGSDGVVIRARDQAGGVGAVVVTDNHFVDVGRAVLAVAYDGGRIDAVTMEGNAYDAVVVPVEASEGVTVSRRGDG